MKAPKLKWSYFIKLWFALLILYGAETNHVYESQVNVKFDTITNVISIMWNILSFWKEEFCWSTMAASKFKIAFKRGNGFTCKVIIPN